jgi:hypothetical protein
MRACAHARMRAARMGTPGASLLIHGCRASCVLQAAPALPGERGEQRRAPCFVLVLRAGARIRFAGAPTANPCSPARPGQRASRQDAVRLHHGPQVLHG